MPDRSQYPKSIERSTQRVSIQWGVLFIFIGLITIAILGGVKGFFFVLYGLGGILLVSWVWLSNNIRSIFIQRKFDDHAHFGQRIPVQLDLLNRGFWPILWLKIDEHLPVELSTPNFFRSIISLAPREKKQFNYVLSCQKRGYYNIGPLEFQSGGFWGLFEGTKIRVSPQCLIVYPRIVPLTHLRLPSQRPVGGLQSHQRLLDDPNRAFGVRPYITGDSLRKIDWKTTAATNRLHVRRFQSSIALDGFIFLNLNVNEYKGRGIFSATEMGVTIAASLAAHLSQHRQSVGLSVLAEDPFAEKTDFFSIPMGKGTAHLMQLLELLARAKRSPSPMPFDESLTLFSAGLPWGTIVFIITSIPGEPMYEVLLGLRKRGLQPVLILTQAGGKFKLTHAKTKEIGVPCFRIERDRDLDIWREEEARVVRSQLLKSHSR